MRGSTESEWPVLGREQSAQQLFRKPNLCRRCCEHRYSFVLVVVHAGSQTSFLPVCTGRCSRRAGATPPDTCIRGPCASAGHSLLQRRRRIPRRISWQRRSRNEVGRALNSPFSLAQLGQRRGAMTNKIHVFTRSLRRLRPSMHQHNPKGILKT